jgi:hypothetical protein
MDGEVFLFLELVQKKTKNNGVSIFSGCHHRRTQHYFLRLKELANMVPSFGITFEKYGLLKNYRRVIII